MEQYILDVGILLVLLLALLFGASRGLLRSLLGVAALIAALFGAAWCANHLSPVVTEWIRPMVESKVLESLQTNNTAEVSALLQTMLLAIGTAGRDAAAAVVGEALGPVVHTAVFIVSFVLLRLLLRLVALPLRLVEKLPVIGLCNRLGGAALGLLSGALIVSLALWASQKFAWLPPQMLRESFLAPYFVNGAYYITSLLS